MTEFKRHHYVPQFYLRNFCVDSQVEKNLASVALFNLRSEIHVPATKIREQCQLSYLYGDDLVFEKLFAKAEGVISGIISEIILTNQPPLKNSAKHFDVLSFIVFQRDRTPTAANAIQKKAAHVKKAQLKLGTKTKGLESYNELENDLTKSVLLSIGADARSCPVLADLWMKVLVNKTEVEFVTSDAPVVVYNQWGQGVREVSPTGWVSLGLQIFWPLSPQHLLLLYDGKIYDASKQPGKTIDVTDARDVNQINSLQLLSCNENIYYSGDVKTAEAINNLPFHLCLNEAESLKSVLTIDDRGQYKIFHNSEMSNLKLDLSFLKVIKSKSKIPLNKRIHQTRPAAINVSNALFGPRPEEFSNEMDRKKHRILETYD
jgi:hypothetical protein